jgi:hypothetical protein
MTHIDASLRLSTTNRSSARGARFAVQSRPGVAPGPAMPGGGLKRGPPTAEPTDPHPAPFQELPLTCVKWVCVSASHARLFGAGCVSGLEGSW